MTSYETLKRALKIVYNFSMTEDEFLAIQQLTADYKESDDEEI